MTEAPFASSEQVTVDVTVNVGFAGSNHRTTIKFEREDWDEMTERDREDAIEEMAMDFAAEKMSVSWELREER